MLQEPDLLYWSQVSSMSTYNLSMGFAIEDRDSIKVEVLHLRLPSRYHE